MARQLQPKLTKAYSETVASAFAYSLGGHVVQKQEFMYCHFDGMLWHYRVKRHNSYMYVPEIVCLWRLSVGETVALDDNRVGQGKRYVVIVH